MDEQKKKAPVWLSLFPAGKPAHKRRMELKKIKDTMKELEVDVEGFDLDTEENFRDFVMAKKTPQSDFELFLKKIFADNAIEYTDREFKKLRKKDCLDVFFEVFTLGLGEADAAVSVETTQFAAPETEGSPPDATESGADGAAQPALLTMAMMDELYQKKRKETVTSISYADFVVTDQIPVRAQDNFSLRLRDNAPAITHGRAALFNPHLKKTVAVGCLVGSRQEPRLVFCSEDMDYTSMQKNRKHEIILFPADEHEDVFYAVSCELKFQKLEEAKRTLCIDFGTSNTTAGSYGVLDEQANQPEIVKFPDVDGLTTRQMIPTLVYVDSCAEGQPIRYAFGYEARRCGSKGGHCLRHLRDRRRHPGRRAEPDQVEGDP